MNNKELQLLRDILSCFPLTGMSLADLSKEINIGTTTLYNYKNGLIPSKERYYNIMTFLLNNHRTEMSKILRFLNTDVLTSNEIEQQIKLYLAR